MLNLEKQLMCQIEHITQYALNKFFFKEMHVHEILTFISSRLVVIFNYNKFSNKTLKLDSTLRH